MEFKANSGVWGTMFGVPFVVADNFLKLATGEQLKVLLYLLRCSGRSCSDEEISRNTGVSPQEAADAVLFWQQVNVLSPQGTAPEAVMPVQPVREQPPVTQPEPPAVQEPAAPRRKQSFTPSEITEMMKTTPDISELFKVAESALGKLSYTQQNSLIWMYSYLGLKKEVIVVLIYYCISIDKASAGYIEKIACSWAENDINTISAAENEVERLRTAKDFTNVVMRLFEMEKSPTPKQAGFISQWQRDGFSADMIKLAYETTLDNINKLNFDYVNKILQSWKASGYTTPKQVRDAESSYRSERRSTGKGKLPATDVEKYKAIINKF
ncbi:MAG: DnaD domain protein [Ruminococcus sp.]|nr:DnaD domain protein [Ruminococcus sp.]